MGLQETMGFPLVSGSFHKTKGKVLFVVLCWGEQMSQFNKVLKPVSSFNPRKKSSLLCFKYSAELGLWSKIALQPDFTSIVCTYRFTHTDLSIYVCMYVWSIYCYLFVWLFVSKTVWFLCFSKDMSVREIFLTRDLCNADCWSHTTTM